MASTRAERLARRTASATAASRPRRRPRGDAAPERHADPEPRVEHPPEGGDAPRTGGGRGGTGASSLHPSQNPAASSLGYPAPSPGVALRMAQELLHYRPVAEAQEAWLNRLTELVGAARVAAPVPSRSLVRSARAGDVVHGAAPPPPIVTPAPRRNSPA